jgi:hypothetical protein
MTSINNWDFEEFDILVNKEGEHMCCLHDHPLTGEWCDANCPKYSSCDTIAWADDEAKLLYGEAWRCPKCRTIVNNGDDCSKCNENE